MLTEHQCRRMAAAATNGAGEGGGVVKVRKGMTVKSFWWKNGRMAKALGLYLVWLAQQAPKHTKVYTT